MEDNVKSADRALQVLSLLTGNPRGLTFAEIISDLDLPKSSTHGLLRTMLNRGYLAQNDDRRFLLGVRVWEAGQAWLRGLDLASVARAPLEAARDQLNETVQLAVLDGVDNVYVAKVEADHRVVLQSAVGSRLPASTTGLGKALLSGLTDEDIRERFSGYEFPAFTERSITSLDGLVRAVIAARDRGYAIDDGEYTPGVYCVAVPVRNHEGAVCAALSVSVPEIRGRRLDEPLVVEVLLTQANVISASLGGSVARRMA